MSRGALAFALLLAACQPRGQLIVHVDTDAEVPASPGEPATRRWLFDRLRIEVLRDGAGVLDRNQSPVSRDFAVDHALFAGGQASIGIAPPVGDSGLTARARLYRSGRLTAGEPTPSSTIDVTVSLPPLAGDSTTDLTVRLHTEDVGRALGPVDPEIGLPGDSEVGTWPGLEEVPCAGQAGDDEVCVPGGAYFMGDPIMRALGAGLDADRERLVVMKPFYIDLHETTVAEYRQHYSALVSQLVQDPILRDLTLDPSNDSAWCTWTRTALTGDASTEALPINCVNLDAASTYCGLRGKDVPSEAQFEFVASGRGEELGYAWGDDEPQCSFATWGRGGIGARSGDIGDCLASGSIGGVAPPGSGTRDRVRLVDAGSGQMREVVDLAGNVGEWVKDEWSRQEEAFWSAPGVFHDPVANLTSPLDGHMAVARGGVWYLTPIALRAAFRQGLPSTSLVNGLGFRCVRSAAP
jgi:formylglycine-generating enzyme required for sulfatase activity